MGELVNQHKRPTLLEDVEQDIQLMLVYSQRVWQHAKKEFQDLAEARNFQMDFDKLRNLVVVLYKILDLPTRNFKAKHKLAPNAPFVIVTRYLEGRMYPSISTHGNRD